jgi:hypothetical protein
MDVSFCVDALDEALARFGRPGVFKGSQFTSATFDGAHFSIDDESHTLAAEVVEDAQHPKLTIG